MKNFFINFLAYFFGFAAVFVLATLIVKVWPIETTDIKSTKILTPTVIAGQEVRWENIYCTYQISPVRVLRELKDSSGRLWLSSDAQSISSKGCGTRTLSMPVPLGATSGSYYVENTFIFSIRGLRDVEYIYKTPAFEVKQPPKIDDIVPPLPDLIPANDELPNQ